MSRGAAVNKKYGAPIGLSDHRFSRNWFEQNHSRTTILGRVIGSSAASGHDFWAHPIVADRSVSVRKNGYALRITVFAGGEVVRATTDQKWADHYAAKVVLKTQGASVVTVLR
jgi:hypothetical protein